MAKVLLLESSQMQTSALTSKGQVTIPAGVRRRLGLHPGDRVGFIVEGEAVRIVRKENRIEAAFGLCKPNKTLSLEQMEQAIKERAGR
jgi:AbrB family looped-hinge helix DNA binding protein